MGGEASPARASRRRASIGFSLAALLAPAACAPASAAPAAAAKPALEGVARYLPLEAATVFSYETTSDPGGERGLLVLEVRRLTPATAELVVAGRATRLNVSDGAIAHPGGGFLLREPLVAGAEWKGDFGHVRVTRTDRAVTVGAGTFTNCVETIEELTLREGQKSTTTVFCPGVGITLRETEAEQGAEHQSERIALKSFGPKFEAAAPSTP